MSPVVEVRDWMIEQMRTAAEEDAQRATDVETAVAGAASPRTEQGP